MDMTRSFKTISEPQGTVLKESDMADPEKKKSDAIRFTSSRR